MKIFMYFLFLLFIVQIKLSEQTLNDFLNKNQDFKDKILKAKVPSNHVKFAFTKCADGKKPKYIDNTPFLIEEPDLCKGKVSIFIAIHSNNPHRQYRQLVRETYGSLSRIDGMVVRMAFFVGASKSEEEQQQLLHESEVNRDIIQRDFMESYRNMSRKHLTVIEWTVKHCVHAQYLLKTDDDVFIDIFHLVRVIKEGHASSGYFCSATSNVRPMKSKKQKWYVTKQEYSKSRYPTYCEGYGYVVSIKHLPLVYVCSMLQKIFWIDDVYVGGVLPELLKISRNGFTPGSGFHYMLPSHASNKILDGIFYVPYYSQLVQSQWRKMWRATIEYSMTI